MKKSVKTILFIGLPSILLTSCGNGLTNHVEEFGDAGFYNTYFADLLVVKDHFYYRAGALEEKTVQTIEMIAAFNYYENSANVYRTDIEGYPGILILEYNTVISSYNDVYVDEDASAVPTSILYDFPHIDDWFNGGQNFELDGIIYSSYGTIRSDSLKGDYLSIGKDKRNYYTLKGYPNWICAENKKEPGSIDICYSLGISELPVELIKLTHDINYY